VHPSGTKERLRGSAMVWGLVMQVRLLGPVDIETTVGTVGLGGPRAQAVVGLLAVRAGEILTADWLIDQLWGERPPPAARTTLQSYVSRLRAVGGSDTERLLPRHPRGYLLDPQAAEIDVREFRRLSARAHTSAADGQRHRVGECLERATAVAWPPVRRDRRSPSACC